MSAQGVIIALAVVAGLAAAGFEIWLGMRQHPKRWALAYAAWTPVAMLFFAGVGWDTAPGGALATALLFGPVAYPIVRGVIWLRFGALDNLHDRQLEEAAAELERLEYRATDFGGQASTPAPERASRATAAVMATPIQVAPARSALGRIAKPVRPRWEGPAEMAVVSLGSILAAAAFVGFKLWDASGGDPRGAYGYDIEAVAATLEMNGHAAPRVQPYGTTANCTGYVYRWKAVGAEGRACVDAYGYVSTWVEKRWPAMGRSAEPV